MVKKAYKNIISNILAVLAVAYNDIPCNERYVEDKGSIEDIFNEIHDYMKKYEIPIPYELEAFYFALGNKDKTRIKEAAMIIKNRI